MNDGTKNHGIKGRVRAAENTEHMYDVIYIDGQGSETPVAQALDDRKDAADMARRVAAERGAGRMVLSGSATPPHHCVCVVPVRAA